MRVRNVDGLSEMPACANESCHSCQRRSRIRTAAKDAGGPGCTSCHLYQVLCDHCSRHHCPCTRMDNGRRICLATGTRRSWKSEHRRAVSLGASVVCAAHHSHRDLGPTWPTVELPPHFPALPLSHNQHTAAIRPRSADVVCHTDSTADVRLVLRGTLLAGIGLPAASHSPGHIPCPGLVRSALPVLIVRPNCPRTDICPTPLCGRTFPIGRGAETHSSDAALRMCHQTCPTLHGPNVQNVRNGQKDTPETVVKRSGVDRRFGTSLLAHSPNFASKTEGSVSFIDASFEVGCESAEIIGHSSYWQFFARFTTKVPQGLSLHLLKLVIVTFINSLLTSINILKPLLMSLHLWKSLIMSLHLWKSLIMSLDYLRVAPILSLSFIHHSKPCLNFQKSLFVCFTTKAPQVLTLHMLKLVPIMSLNLLKLSSLSRLSPNTIKSSSYVQ